MKKIIFLIMGLMLSNLVSAKEFSAFGIHMGMSESKVISKMLSDWSPQIETNAQEISVTFTKKNRDATYGNLKIYGFQTVFSRYEGKDALYKIVIFFNEDEGEEKIKGVSDALIEKYEFEKVQNKDDVYFSAKYGVTASFTDKFFIISNPSYKLKDTLMEAEEEKKKEAYKKAAMDDL